MRQHSKSSELDMSDTFSGVTLAGREPIAHCSSCGKSTWYEIPSDAKPSVEIDGLRWYSFECPHCRSGHAAVCTDDGVLSEKEAESIVRKHASPMYRTSEALRKASDTLDESIRSLNKIGKGGVR
jgi:transcription elongation factor Elf1